jgi:hypothetical protein
MPIRLENIYRRLFPHVPPSEKENFLTYLKDINTWRNRYVSFAFLLWIGAMLVLDIVLFAGEGEGVYYLILDSVAFPVTAFSFAVSFLSVRRIARIGPYISAVILVVWTGMVSAFEESLISLIIGTLLASTFFYSRGWVHAVLIAGGGFFFVGLPSFSENIDRVETVELIQTGSLLFWAWVIGRVLYASATRTFLKELELKNVNDLLEGTIGELEEHKRNQDSEIRARTRDLAEANRRLSRELEQNSLLTRELHHRVKNNMQLISSILSLSLREPCPPESVVERCGNRIKTMAYIHNEIYAAEDLRELRADTFLERLVSYLMIEYFPAEDDTPPAGMRESYARFSLRADCIIPLGLIVGEIFARIAAGISSRQGDLFSGGGRAGGGLSVICDLEDGVVGVTVEEGFGITYDEPWGLGFEIAESLSGQLGGHFWVADEEVRRYLLTFPLPAELTSSGISVCSDSV